MPLSKTFARDIKVATAGLEPQAISALIARTGRAVVLRAQEDKEFPSAYIKAVNGRIGAQEESVIPPGPIIYTAIWWPEIISYGIAFAIHRSPHSTKPDPDPGVTYRQSWIALANGQQTTDYAAIPLTAEVIITNFVPYARRIEIGRQRVNVPPGIVEDLVSALRRRYGDLLNVRRKFISLEGAYRLQKGSKPGSPVTAPAAVIEMRF